MKYFMLLLPLLLLGVACSSPEEKRSEREAEAQEEYNEEMKEAQEDYKDDRKDEAKDMVDDSDEVERMDKEDGEIEVDD